MRSICGDKRCWLLWLALAGCGGADSKPGGDTAASTSTPPTTLATPTTTTSPTSSPTTTAPTTTSTTTTTPTTTSTTTTSTTTTVDTGAVVIEQIPPAPEYVVDPGICQVQIDCSEEIVDEPKITCSMEVQDAAGYPLYEGWAGVEKRGRSSAIFPKAQYSVELRETEDAIAIPPGSEVAWWNAPAPPAEGWEAPAFDDSGWTTGAAPLGVGDASCSPQGWKYGHDDWACPAGSRMPAPSEWDMVESCITPADDARIDYYHNVGISAGGCGCKWNPTWCGSPSVETFDGSMCGDFDQLHICIQELATDLGGPGALPATAYFRLDFEIDDPTLYEHAILTVSRDDGIRMLLNGVELYRANVPAGPLGHFTRALVPEHGRDVINIDPATLLAGVNVLSAEVHQASPDGGDVLFDAELMLEGDDVSVDFYDMGGESDWVLNGAYADISLYRNAFFYDLFNSFGDGYAPETHFCEVTLNGVYEGVYQLTERIKRDDDRLDISEELGDGGSFILKQDDAEGYWTGAGFPMPWQIVYPKLADATDGTYEGVDAVMGAWSDALVSRTGFWDTVDLDSFVDFVILQELASNGDSYILSIHIYKDRDTKLKFTPWDCDLCAGNNCAGTSGWNYRWGFVDGMFEDPEFQAAIEARWAELRTGPLTDAAVHARIDAMDAALAPVAAANFDRWPTEDIIGGDDWVLAILASCPTYTWEEETAEIRAWMIDRMAWLDSNIADI